MDRKTFLKSTFLGAAGVGTGILSCKNSPTESNVVQQNSKLYKWKMVTTWPPNFPVLGEACTLFAQWVKELSQGQMSITVYGAGELIPAMEVFDAVSNGAAEMGNGASYYWAGRHPSTPYFTSVPFGLNAQQMNAWLYSGEGMHLWNELYAKYNLKPFPSGNTGVQMAGWFNRKMNTIADFKGLKMRMPGLGAKVISKIGATAVLSSGSEIYTNLERGVIDATEWIGPYHDYIMGFHKIAKYYYAPGWHETGSTLENIINLREYNALPRFLQEVLETASSRMNVWVLSEFEAKNNLYLKKIKEESKVELLTFSPEILSALRDKAREVLNEISMYDEMAQKIHQSYFRFYKEMNEWSTFSEKAFYNLPKL